ncbi:MAG: rhombosortase [Acidobacteriota bacterium]
MRPLRDLWEGGLALHGTAWIFVLQAIPAWADALQYDRRRIAAGEVWRLVTGHLAHWSWGHALWDGVAFALLVALALRLDRRRLPVVLLASAVAISLAVWFAEPGLRLYRGLSGIDAALFAFVAAALVRRGGRARLVGGIALLLLGAKIAWEMTTGGTLFVAAVDAGFVTVALAHWVGAAVGLAVGFSRSQTERALGRPRRLSWVSRQLRGSAS